MLNSKLSNTLVQLACVKPAASVRSEPGSNSHIKMISQSCLSYFLQKNLLGSFRNITDFIILYSTPSAYPLFFLFIPVVITTSFFDVVISSAGELVYRTVISECQHKK